VVLLVIHQRRQQLLVDCLAHGRQDGGAAGVHVLDHPPQFIGAGLVQTPHSALAGLFGGGATGYLQSQGLEMAQQVFLVDQIGVHHDAFPC